MPIFPAPSIGADDVDEVLMTVWWLLYLALGAFSGFFAGLLGIGGGAVLVPLLVMFFTAQQFPSQEVMHLALGTSMAAILFTSISSVRAHHQLGAVQWPIVIRITPGILLGTLLGTEVASRVPSTWLAILFTVFIFYVAVQMIVGFKPKPSRELPGVLGTGMVGVGIGAFSCLVAIGGGVLSVPFMVWCNVRVQHAIGTSAAIGFPIALGGAAGYIYNGWRVEGLPEFSLGFVYLPALVGLVAASVLTAPLGARLAHQLPVNSLRRVFAGLLLLLALKMSWGLLAS
ncbi:MAG: sulfite exporter TauE/SafE family protein [Azovibrio sp.]|uniref:sulfite exporter TauE/SafE family protein n=1 Tax=Azovibrio sp. TaxID=1872673 RepID=UPI003C71923C